MVVIDGYEAVAEIIENGVSYTYKNPEGELLSAAVGKAIRKRQAVFGGFDVLKEENAWGGVFVVRNEDLVDSSPTVPDFRYQTPLIRFIDPLTPLLDPNIEIPLGQFTPGEDPHPLVTFLANFFDVFFEGAVSPGESRTLAMGGGYAYDLVAAPAGEGGPEPLGVELPVFLTTPQPFPISEPGSNNAFLQSVSEQVTNWLNIYTPEGITTNGRLIFDLTIYASLADSRLPV